MTFFITPFHYTDCFSVRQIGYGGKGFPRLYGKETLTVEDGTGSRYAVMAYTMNPPYCQQQAVPSHQYLQGILDGCRQNGIAQKPILQVYNKVRKETLMRQKKYEKKNDPIR